MAEEHVDWEFRAFVERMALRALASSSRARDMAIEWPAFGFAAGAAYLVVAPWRPKDFGAFDVMVLTLLLGCGFACSLAEWEIAKALRKLGEKLTSEIKSSS